MGAPPSAISFDGGRRGSAGVDGGRVSGEFQCRRAGLREGAGQCGAGMPVLLHPLITLSRSTKLPTKLATKLMKALKGRDIPAQGNALGNGAKND